MIMNGKTVMTRDFFDFQVLHLSSTTNQLPRDSSGKFYDHLLDKMTKTAAEMKSDSEAASFARRRSEQKVSNRTVALIPFSSSAASLHLANEDPYSRFNRKIRLQFFLATFWSVYRFFPNIIITTASKEDQDAVKSLLLPIIALVDLSNEVKDKMLLPKHSLKYLQTAMNTPSSKDSNIDWGIYQYIYYTEGDHMLYSRSLKQLITVLDRSNGTVCAVPHRMQVTSLIHIHRVSNNDCISNRLSRSRRLILTISNCGRSLEGIPSRT